MNKMKEKKEIICKNIGYTLVYDCACSLQQMQKSVQNLAQKQKRKNVSWKMKYMFSVFVAKVMHTNLI